jgi:hypothetical protein
MSATVFSSLRFPPVLIMPTPVIRHAIDGHGHGHHRQKQDKDQMFRFHESS